MSEQQQQNNPIPLPPITKEVCKTINTIFLKYDNVDDKKLQQIIKLIRKSVDENKILEEVKITKNKLYRYLCRWMVENQHCIKVKHSPRGYGKNNYNKFEAKLKDIICGLENNFTITELCWHVGLSHQTMIKYLYKLMNTEQEAIFV